MNEVLFDSNETQNILMSANAFHTLKNNLFNNIGSYKTKGFLFRLGKEFGLESAKKNLQNQQTEKTVGKRHSRLGHVKDVIFMGEIVRHPDGTIECKDTWGPMGGIFRSAIAFEEFGLGG